MRWLPVEDVGGVTESSRGSPFSLVAAITAEVGGGMEGSAVRLVVNGRLAILMAAADLGFIGFVRASNL